MKLKTGLWVVVADGSRAIVLENQGTAANPALKVLRVYDQDNPRTHELGRDQSPRTVQSAGRRKSALETPDLHQVAEDRFIEGIVVDLQHEVASGALGQVVVVAPPVALGSFRKCANDHLSKRVVAWIDKDLTKMPVPVITEAVANALES